MTPSRRVVLSLLAWGALARGAPSDGGAAFRLEPRPLLDDLFGDAADYRRIVDKFLQLHEALERTREDFARTVQAMLLDAQPAAAKAPPKGCPESVESGYPRALKMGAIYLRTGRELTRYYEQVREFDRLGETVGLTPDYRVKVKRVAQQYGALLTDYREMKIALHEQLAGELRHRGCDVEKVAARMPPGEERWSAAEEPGALALAAPVAPPALTKEPAAPPRPPAPLPMIELSPDLQPARRANVLFYVDNTRCRFPARVSIDGKPLGEAAPLSRAGFAAPLGPHDLCVLSDASLEAGKGKRCGDPGTVRRNFLHDGWTIALRCN